jgi:hypothetical protein
VTDRHNQTLNRVQISKQETPFIADLGGSFLVKWAKKNRHERSTVD